MSKAKKNKIQKTVSAKSETTQLDLQPKANNLKEQENQYNLRLSEYIDELKWLYMELYDSQYYFDELLTNIHNIYLERKDELKKLDIERLKNPNWYKGNNMLGMMMYVDLFADNLEGLEKNLDYIKSNKVNYLHLMPLLKSPYGRSDGGYAVCDFRNVQPELGNIEQLEHLADKCREHGISMCLDFVINHTSEEHEWAVRAKNGEREYMDRYFFFDDYSIPAEYEKTVPQVFPNTAPGNFTYLESMHKFVMTTFNSYQWDLNYKNPIVFNEMLYNLLYLANKGVEILRIDAVPYIWKELGTNCRNLPRVHTIMRMFRIVCEIVCPGILLKGEVVMAPDKVLPYFGTVEKPECHLLYNVTTMACTWNSLATGDTRLLKNQINMLGNLPSKYIFLNYLRCHDDIGWGLDEDALRYFGIDPGVNKKYLNDFYSGVFPNTFARGELYNCDPITKDARICGTTASLCGIEKAVYENNETDLKIALQRDIMLHAFMFTLSGLPVIYSGDEVGQLNDYSYKENPVKVSDSRYVHRGKFDWNKIKEIKNTASIAFKIYDALHKLEQLRSTNNIFRSEAKMYALETGDISILSIVRELDDDRLIATFNFSPYTKTININQGDNYKNLITKKDVNANTITIEPYGYLYYIKTE